MNHVGEKYHDFVLTNVKEFPELQCVLKELTHVPTGAKVMHIENEDPENLFCLSFRTLPDSSNGVAHILEHTVLCGSDKYPVKDPFFSMTRRSLNTFMNALTGSDFTCYPASSQVPKDFYNLLEVYIDAVFHPLLNEVSFLQEGHRLEFTIPDDATSSLERKGVVYNEMKGALSSASARLSEEMNKALFPNLTYGCNSGGDPKDIPQLTYTELCAFHQTFYHPSRCLFFFYGNLPLEEHLDFIATHALKDVKKLEPIPQISVQPRFSDPKFLTTEYPLAPDEDKNDKTVIAFGWLTCHILKQQELLALSILEIILMDTDASLLKHAFLKSGLCKQATIAMDTEISEVPVMITLKGCNEENADALEGIMRKTLQDLIHNGIPPEQFENAIHQLEFARSEITGNHAPYGLSLFMRTALLQQHGGNPEDGLLIHSLFDQVREKHLSDPHYLTGLLQKYFLDNPHFVRIVMLPNPSLGAKELDDEYAELKKIKEELTPGQVKHILTQTRELNAFQQKQEEEDIDVLPRITLQDVPKVSRDYPITKEKLGKLQLYHHSCFTNEIIYANFVYDLPLIKEQDLPYVRLLASLLSQMGCDGRNYIENLEYIQAHTGGVGAALAFNIQAHDAHQFFPTLEIRGKALHRKADKLFSLMGEMALGIDLSDVARLKEIILKQHTSFHSAFNNHALRYAMNLASSGLDRAGRLANIWFGLDYYDFIKDLAGKIDEKLDEIVDKLQKMQGLILGLEHPDLVVTCNSEMFEHLKKQQFYSLTTIPTRSFSRWQADISVPQITSQGRVISTPVAFTAQVFPTIPYIHADAPALNVAAHLFDNLVLHALIREQGGAYGGGSSSNALGGNFTFYAYRDPNISSTLEAFQKAVDTIVLGNFDESDLEEAKLEVIQGLDAPVAPGSRGDLTYSRLREGRPPEVRQGFRDRLIALTKEEVINAVKQHIVPRLPQSTTVIFAGKELLEKENTLLPEQGKHPFDIYS